jgi:hypothetical protein
MGLILTRSPFHISRGTLDANASLTVQVGRINGNNLGIQETYSLNFRNNLFIDISNLCAPIYEKETVYIGAWGQYINDIGDLKFFETGYITVTLSGSIGGTAQSDQVTNYFCTDGYAYSSEKIDKDFVEELTQRSFYAGSSDTIYKLDDSNIRIPILNPTMYSGDEYVDVSFMSKGDVVYTESLLYRDSGTASFTISRWAKTFDYPSFLNRVKSDDGKFEDSQCVEDFFNNNKIEDVDQVLITAGGLTNSVKVKTVEECKYNPYRITFKNKYGVMEDLWFFKKSIESISVKADDFRANQFKQRSAGGRGNDAGLIRSNQEYNKNGTTSITLNSGFVDEALNESFKQLMLSEEVELYDFDNDVLSAVKVSNSELKLKTSTNDKLINYTIDVEFSNNIIDNIV